MPWFGVETYDSHALRTLLRVLAKRFDTKKARVAVVRKLAVIITAIIKDGMEFWWKAEAVTPR